MSGLLIGAVCQSRCSGVFFHISMYCTGTSCVVSATSLLMSQIPCSISGNMRSLCAGNWNTLWPHISTSLCKHFSINTPLWIWIWIIVDSSLTADIATLWSNCFTKSVLGPYQAPLATSLPPAALPQLCWQHFLKMSAPSIPPKGNFPRQRGNHSKKSCPGLFRR